MSGDFIRRVVSINHLTTASGSPLYSVYILLISLSYKILKANFDCDFDHFLPRVLVLEAPGFYLFVGLIQLSSIKQNIHPLGYTQTILFAWKFVCIVFSLGVRKIQVFFSILSANKLFCIVIPSLTD
jgi:hypothetical protein